MSRRALIASLVGVSIIGVALIPEMILRLSFTRHEVNGNYWAQGAFAPHETAGYIHTPGYEGRAVRRGAFDTPVSINRFGLRQSNLDAQLEYPTRVLLLGDSFTLGLGVSEDEAFAGLIQKRLNRTGVGIINGAQTGYGVTQASLLGRELIERFEPDIVVSVLFPYNDVEADYNERHERVEVTHGFRLPKNRLFADTAIDRLRTSSFGWMIAERELTRWRAQATLADFNRTARKNPSLVMQPSLAALDSLGEQNESITFAAVIIPPDHRGSPFDRRFTRALRKNGVPVLNLEKTGFGASDFFDGDGHWNAVGHGKAAQAISPFVRQLAKRHARLRRHDVERSIEVVQQTEQAEESLPVALDR